MLMNALFAGLAASLAMFTVVTAFDGAFLNVGTALLGV